MPLSVDVKEGPLVPKPVPGLAVKASLGPQIEEDGDLGDLGDLCIRLHSLLPPTLQLVTPLLSPKTVQVKVKLASGQMEGAAMNWPVGSPGGEQ